MLVGSVDITVPPVAEILANAPNWLQNCPARLSRGVLFFPICASVLPLNCTALWFVAGWFCLGVELDRKHFLYQNAIHFYFPSIKELGTEDPPLTGGQLRLALLLLAAVWYKKTAAGKIPNLSLRLSPPTGDASRF